MNESRKILDGKALAGKLRVQLAEETAAFTVRHSRPPGLAVIIVGDDPASHVYVNQKAKGCAQVGIRSLVTTLGSDTTEKALLEQVHSLNDNPDYDGILVQLPLPPQISEEAVIEAISPEKDVDGFHPQNLGELILDRPRFVPCTPLGIMKLLEHSNIDPGGMEAVIIGRSHIVGKPAAALLMGKNATVTVCHSRTRRLEEHTRRADLIVAAVGKPGIVTADMVKDGVVVVDVGVNRLEGKKLVGDVDFDGILPKARAITPVPGGVGPMTITMLLSNTLHAARLIQGEDPSKQ